MEENKRIIGVEYIKTLPQTSRIISSEGIQDIALREYAENNNITVMKKYIDNGDANALRQLMDDADSKNFQVVLVYNLSRFARNTYDIYSYLTKLKEKGIKVIFVKEQFQDNPLGELAMSMQIAMNDYWKRHPKDNEEIEQI